MFDGHHAASGGNETASRRRASRDQEREALRRLRIEFADKLWLAQNHPCDDSVIAWLCENRAEASKIGSSRWNLETLPGLVARQEKLRNTAAFETLLSGFPQIPQIPQNQTPDPVENTKSAAQPRARRQRKDAGMRR